MAWIKAGSGKAVVSQVGLSGFSKCVHIREIGLPAGFSPGCRVRIFAVTSKYGVPVINLTSSRTELTCKPREIRERLFLLHNCATAS